MVPKCSSWHNDVVIVVKYQGHSFSLDTIITFIGCSEVPRKSPGQEAFYPGQI